MDEWKVDWEGGELSKVVCEQLQSSVKAAAFYVFSRFANY
jgi:hypothetical protein